jgi:hypothetical protein
MYRVMRLSQGQAPVVVDDLPTEAAAERLWAACERLPRDRLTSHIVQYDEADYFAVKPEQRNFYQEGVCRPGWIGSMPEPPAAPLYKPNERGNDQ